MSTASEHIVEARLPDFGVTVRMDGRTREISVSGAAASTTEMVRDIVSGGLDLLEWPQSGNHADAADVLESLLDGFAHGPVVVAKEVFDASAEDEKAVG